MRLTKLLGSNMEITEAIRAYVNDRLVADVERFTTQFDAEGTTLAVECGKTTNHHKQGDVYRCEAMLTPPGSQVFRAEATKDDLYAAIDAVKDDLRRQVKDAEKKSRTKDRRGAKLLKKLREYIPFLGESDAQ